MTPNDPIAAIEAPDPELRIPPDVAEKLNYYVYLYIDPRTNTPFYVGKGKGSRALAHVDIQNESSKSARLAEIRAAGMEPRIDILIHGLAVEAAAFAVEAAVIDVLQLAELTNES